MADENHSQMIMQQQPPPSQQSHMQSTQLQPSQAQQAQMQQSHYNKANCSSPNCSRLSCNNHNFSKPTCSNRNSSKASYNNLSYSSLSCNLLNCSSHNSSNSPKSSNSLLCNNNNSPNSKMYPCQWEPQQLQAIQPNVNTSSGTPVQMAVSQLTPQAQTLSAGTMMSQSSGPHPTMMHPTMTMAQAPLQQVQVIQQPLSTSYLQHLYSPHQQMIFPSNLTLQHAGMATSTLQSLGATQGLSLQLQAKATLDPKTSEQAMAVNAGTMMTASGQVIGTSKSNFPQQMMTGPGKSTIIHSQSAIADSQKGKTYAFQSQPATLQPKSLYSSTLPVHSSTQVFNGSHIKQISSQPQIITTQAPGTMFSQAQLLGLQTLSPLPPGLTWATPGCLQSTALQLGQNPIIIRSQQSDMFIQQTQPQTAMHLPVAAASAATQPVPPTSYASASAVPQKQKQVKIKPKVRTPTGPSPGVSPAPSTPQMATTQTQTNQSPPQPAPPPPAQPVVQQKSDAGNQTYSNQIKVMTVETKSTGMQSKSVSVETKQVSSPQKSQAMVAPSTKILQASVTPTPTVDVSVSVAPSTLTTVSSTSSVLTTATVQVNTSVSSVNTMISTVPSISSVAPVPVVTNKVVIPEISKPLSSETHNESANSSQQTNTTEAMVTTEHLKPQQPIQKPSLGPIKDKQPQKAIVKPQVLTHVIDGLVIQEGPEPFPVSRSALLDSPLRIPPSEKPDSHLKRKDSPTVASPEKKMKVHRARGGPGRKRKMFRGRKGLRKQPRIEDEEMNTTRVEENISAPDDESTVSNKTEEEHSEAPSDSPHQTSMEVEKTDVEIIKTESDVTNKLPNKWTVQDVFEFIQNLPGCSDYADTFKSQEIDGQALLLLKEDHLMTAMCMKLGPALKLISQIRSMKEELGQS
ncbi:polyhomeotic-like protein 3 [Caerostris extrusa]|uniref:Polyhomeotic-like protein 3 n=1 Tax=Caerostris extrusa TaxID=172846 RepID=A0AAV4MMM0_CAEEX|nr:polyhomeotic-like protein 3 [Caerostris extrusa]